MATIIGTDGNDDGIANPSLFGANGDTVFGLGGDDLLATSGSIFDSSPLAAGLFGGAGADRYSIGQAFTFPVYDTPIQWWTVWSNAVVHEDALGGGPDMVEALGATAANTVISFDGSAVLVLTTFIFSVRVPFQTLRTITLADAYGVDAGGVLQAGVETLSLGSGATVVSLSLTASNPLLPFLTLLTATEDSFTGTASAEVIDGHGGADRLAAGAGHDLVTGGMGDDMVKGGDGNDRLHGGEGADRLKGQAGDDTLDGGAGDDRLSGGGGRDVFVFGAGAGSDEVADFAQGKDRLDLSALFSSFAEAAAALSDAGGGNARLTAAGTDILLLGFGILQFDEADAIFG